MRALLGTKGRWFAAQGGRFPLFEISVGENVCEVQRSEDAFPITSVVMDGVVCGSVGEGRSVDELPVDGGEVLSTVNNRNLRQLGDAGGSWVCECGILVQVF